MRRILERFNRSRIPIILKEAQRALEWGAGLPKPAPKEKPDAHPGLAVEEYDRQSNQEDAEALTFPYIVWFEGFAGEWFPIGCQSLAEARRCVSFRRAGEKTDHTMAIITRPVARKPTRPEDH